MHTTSLLQLLSRQPKSTEKLVEEISKFHWYLKNPKDVDACLPPMEIIPWEFLYLEGDIGDVSKDVLQVRVIGFVHKLVDGNVEAWKPFIRQLSSVDEAKAYLADFLDLYPKAI